MTATAERPGALEVWQVVQRAQDGDVDAMAELYDRYVTKVYKFAYFKTGSVELAEDITADTFYRALKRIGSFTWQGKDFGCWLLTIARNLIADHYKSHRYRREFPVQGTAVGDRDRDEDTEGAPEDAVVAHLTNLQMLEALSRLTDEQRECVTLRFLMDRTVAETAQIMGKNPSVIKSLQLRAVRALRRALPELEPDALTAT